MRHCGTYTFGVVHEVDGAVAGLSPARHNFGTTQGFSDAGHVLGAVQGFGGALHGLGAVRGFGGTVTGPGTAQISISNAHNLEAGRGRGMGYGGRLSSARSLGTAGGLGSGRGVTTAMIPSRGDAASFCGGTADGFCRAHDLGGGTGVGNRWLMPAKLYDKCLNTE